MRISRISPVLVGVVLLAGFASAQNPQLQTKNGKRFPTVVFSYVLWTADPSYYSIAIDATGTSTYQSAPNSIDRSGVPYSIEFEVSDRTRRTTFNVSQRLNFFVDPIPASTGYPGNTAVRTLSYHDHDLVRDVTYSSSPNADIEELTSVFEEISETLEFGRRLAYYRDHDKKSLGQEIEKMEASAKSHQLRELQAVARVLNDIVSDQSLDEQVRSNASDLLKLARSGR